MKTIYILTRYVLPILTSVLALSFVLILSSCSEEPTAPEEEFTEIEPGINTDIPLDEGNVGLVIDTREIFRKGYIPTTAQISFPNFPRFDTTLAINPYTNLAILSIHNSSLSEEDSAAFANGVTTTIDIMDGTQSLRYDQSQRVLDNSNSPLSLTTSEPYVLPPVKINENFPYLLQIEGHEQDGVLWYEWLCVLGFCFDVYNFSNYTPNSSIQEFHFTSFQNNYLISNYSEAFGAEVYWRVENNIIKTSNDPNLYSEFELEQEAEGWVRIRHTGTNLYVFWNDGLGLNETGDRFRFISNYIDWQVEDLGTNYHQPIMPPVKLDFAYSATLLNCSSAMLEQTIGTTESRTRTTTISSTEGLQLFNSNTVKVGISTSFSVTAKIGIEGLGGLEINTSTTISSDYTYTNSTTTTQENTWTETNSETIVVSSVRTITLGPFTAVEAFDAIKTVENIIVPYTQRLRIKATDTGGAALSGDEIVTQLYQNFTTGVISNVGSNFVEITIRGNAEMNKLFKSTTNVSELENACN